MPAWQPATPREADKLADKVANLRIFQDEAGKLNLSVRDIVGAGRDSNRGVPNRDESRFEAPNAIDRVWRPQGTSRLEDSVLAIPNFTLLADARKGRRPGRSSCHRGRALGR